MFDNQSEYSMSSVFARLANKIETGDPDFSKKDLEKLTGDLGSIKLTDEKERLVEKLRALSIENLQSSLNQKREALGMGKF